ncbi:hypothetical protein H9L13_01830 [Sphingomonas lutea]|uniref:Uncharacterized protein n=1 Tax=Sphingomonas lutea TaxID=1045317 RepID=A0A7G9SIN4_9SPHN|nr:hypothetical protein [Sphingomonas lutea]QNN67709.1 hypothetical protein H9L13_01830 [Sphingomonas lutea]
MDIRRKRPSPLFGATGVSDAACRIEQAADAAQARAAVTALDAAIKDALGALDQLRPQAIHRAC